MHTDCYDCTYFVTSKDRKNYILKTTLEFVCQMDLRTELESKMVTYKSAYLIWDSESSIECKTE